MALTKRCLCYIFMAILISLSFLHITNFKVFIILQLNSHGANAAMTVETTLSYSLTRVLKMAYIILMMLNTCMFFFCGEHIKIQN